MTAKLVIGVLTAIVTLSKLSIGSLQSFRKVSTGNIHNADLGPDFRWDSISPTTELIWHECYVKLQCARLEVPLDYADPEGRKAAIALIRKPALISPKLPFYKGPVLFNPGGPGGSGVDLVRQTATLFSIILGPQFDIVSFDPRGVGRSTPRASFFRTDAERALFEASNNFHVSNSSEGGILRAWAASQLLGTLAGDNDDGYLPHINTPNTARDMLRIVEAHGEEKLQYWGFSYGSILGATFATMFPDKIKRMVIDGVVDAYDYYSTGWRTNLEDTDKAFDAFLTGCAAAGPERCSFYAQDPEDIRRNLALVLNKVKHQPIPVRTEKSYGLVDEWMLRSVIFRSLYSPRGLFSLLADGLAKLVAGDPSFIFSLASPEPRFECSGDRTDSQVVREGTVAILCNDGSKVPEDPNDAENHFRDLSQLSQFADMWAGIRMACTRWPNPSASFGMPFEGNTSHPILLIGNTADPVTPLSSAKKMSHGFKGSVVLTQDSPGHCSIAAPSICTQTHIRQYFIHGALPDDGTVCKTIGTPFPPRIPRIVAPDSKQAVLDGESDDVETDVAFWTAVEELSLMYPIHVPSHSR